MTWEFDRLVTAQFDYGNELGVAIVLVDETGEQRRTGVGLGPINADGHDLVVWPLDVLDRLGHREAYHLRLPVGAPIPVLEQAGQLLLMRWAHETHGVQGFHGPGEPCDQKADYGWWRCGVRVATTPVGVSILRAIPWRCRYYHPDWPEPHRDPMVAGLIAPCARPSTSRG